MISIEIERRRIFSHNCRFGHFINSDAVVSGSSGSQLDGDRLEDGDPDIGWVLRLQTVRQLENTTGKCSLADGSRG